MQQNLQLTHTSPKLASTKAAIGFHETLDPLGTPVLLIALDGSVVEATAAYCSLLGRSLLDLRGTNLDDFLSPANRSEDRGRWQRLVEGRIRTYRRRMTVVRSDGRLVDTRSTLTLVLDTRHRPENVYCFSDPLGDCGPHDLTGPPIGFRLTEVERVILATVAAGEELRDAAARAHLSRGGLAYHVVRLRRRLGLPDSNTRIAAVVARAFAWGLLVPGTWPPAIDDAWT